MRAQKQARNSFCGFGGDGVGAGGAAPRAAAGGRQLGAFTQGGRPRALHRKSALHLESFVVSDTGRTGDDGQLSFVLPMTDSNYVPRL